jgi:hypothetical protein
MAAQQRLEAHGSRRLALAKRQPRWLFSELIIINKPARSWVTVVQIDLSGRAKFSRK